MFGASAESIPDRLLDRFWNVDVTRVVVVHLAVAGTAFATEFGCPVRVRVERAQGATANGWSGSLTARFGRRLTLSIYRCLPL
jgi:hypothetical protein